MHPDEQSTDHDLVRRLLASQFPAWADLELRSVASSGTDNALYRLGSDLVVRLPRIHWAVDDVAKEQRWLPVLAPHLPLTVPAPVGLGVPGAGYPWPWSVYAWLGGNDVATDPPHDLVALARDLGDFVVALHGIDAAGAPPADPEARGAPLAVRDGATRAAIAALGSSVDVAAVTAEWDRALAAQAWDGPPVWVHGDLTPGNLLVEDGRLSAVIDFGALSTGDPAVDLLVAWNLFDGPSRKAYRDVLGVDDATWARGRGWALSVALLALPYYRDTNPAIVASSLRVLTQLAAP